MSLTQLFFSDKVFVVVVVVCVGGVFMTTIDSSSLELMCLSFS